MREDSDSVAGCKREGGAAASATMRMSSGVCVGPASTPTVVCRCWGRAGDPHPPTNPRAVRGGALLSANCRTRAVPVYIYLYKLTYQ